MTTQDYFQLIIEKRKKSLSEVRKLLRRLLRLTKDGNYKASRELAEKIFALAEGKEFLNLAYQLCMHCENGLKKPAIKTARSLTRKVNNMVERVPRPVNFVMR